MIHFQKTAGQRVLELGCGENRHPAADVAVDVRQLSGVDFTCDLENPPWPIETGEFDAIYSAYLAEHIPYPKLPNFLLEAIRVLKPGGKVVFLVPNTEAQLAWIQENKNGWDGKDAFRSCSEVLFGTHSPDYKPHSSYLSPEIAQKLFRDAGFNDVHVTAWNERGTDMLIQAGKPKAAAADVIEPVEEKNVEIGKMVEKPQTVLSMTREEMFDKHYWEGGDKVGGYARDQFGGAYRDFPVHEITARHILARRPESVLELGAARGYILKRLQDAGVVAAGMEISRHCWMTRVCEGIKVADLCVTPWVVPDHHTQVRKDVEYDLCFSIAVLEHVPEEFLPAVIGEMKRTCKRGFHGIDFGQKDDGFDKTHCTLHDKNWWVEKFAEYAPGWPVEVVDKEELERGEFPPEVVNGDGKVKLNCGCFTTMHHHGWLNLDQHDLTAFAAQNGYRFQQVDLRRGLPFGTGAVDLVASNHFLEHLGYDEGKEFLRECRRVLKPDVGAMRVVVPDARLLASIYAGDQYDGSEFNRFAEISDGVAKAETPLRKLWELLAAGHMAFYDQETLALFLTEAGFVPQPSTFRQSSEHPGLAQIRKEVNDMMPELSLFVNAVPNVG